MAKTEKFTTGHTYRGRGVFEPPIPLGDFMYNTVARKGPISRAGLVDLTGVPRSTIFTALRDLIKAGWIKKYSVPSCHRGRPRVFYEVTSD